MIFRNWVLQNFPFIEDDFDALTDYELFCKIVGYMKESLEKIEDFQSDIDSFTLKLDEFEHYFDNLDVQEEINNKLDEMVTDGSLQLLINSYFSYIDDNINEIKNEVEQTLENQNLKINSQDGEINVLTSRMDSFSSLTDGSTTGDAELIDGRISFTGRTYSNIGDNIRNNQKTIFGVDITSDTSKVTLIQNLKYVNHNYSLSSSSAYSCYKLKTKKGCKYYIQCTTAGVSTPQVVFGKDKTIPEWPIADTQHVESILLDGTGSEIYINHGDGLGVSLKIYEKEEIELYNYYEDITNSLVIEDGKYISPTGSINSVSVYKLAKFIPKKGHKYLIKTYTQQAAPGLRQSNKNFPDITYDNNTVVYNNLYDYFSLSNDMIYINLLKNTDLGIGDFKVYESKQLYIPTESQELSNNFTGASDNVIFVGDSLTYGQTYTGTSESYHNFYNYPYFMKKLNNINNIVELAQPGDTTTLWWNRYENSITNDNSIYIVWLGTNDNFTDTVSIDCVGDDYTTYANTETGNFGKILGKIKSLSNNKIIILNNFTSVGNLATNNKVINDLANKFNCILVDINNSDVRNSNYHTAYNGYYNGVHFNNAGHNYVANFVTSVVNEYLKSNNAKLEIRKNY